MIATQASPGQGTLRIAAEKAPPGAMSVIIIQNRKTGEGLRYTRKKRLYYNTLPSIRAVTSQS
jgi:hypothetical protein